MSEAFAGNRRLTRGDEFRRTYSKGKAYATPLFVCHILESGDCTAPARLGISASKRVGRSHERVRYKRWAREVFRRAPLRGGLDVVVSFRPEIRSADFDQFRAALVRIFERARLYEQ